MTSVRYIDDGQGCVEGVPDDYEPVPHVPLWRITWTDGAFGFTRARTDRGAWFKARRRPYSQDHTIARIERA